MIMLMKASTASIPTQNSNQINELNQLQTQDKIFFENNFPSYSVERYSYFLKCYQPQQVELFKKDFKCKDIPIFFTLNQIFLKMIEDLKIKIEQNQISKKQQEVEIQNIKDFFKLCEIVKLYLAKIIDITDCSKLPNKFKKIDKENISKFIEKYDYGFVYDQADNIEQYLKGDKDFDSLYKVIRKQTISIIKDQKFLSTIDKNNKKKILDIFSVSCGYPICNIYELLELMIQLYTPNIKNQQEQIEYDNLVNTYLLQIQEQYNQDIQQCQIVYKETSKILTILNDITKEEEEKEKNKMGSRLFRVNKLTKMEIITLRIKQCLSEDYMYSMRNFREMIFLYYLDQYKNYQFNYKIYYKINKTIKNTIRQFSKKPEFKKNLLRYVETQNKVETLLGKELPGQEIKLQPQEKPTKIKLNYYQLFFDELINEQKTENGPIFGTTLEQIINKNKISDQELNEFIMQEIKNFERLEEILLNEKRRMNPEQIDLQIQKIIDNQKTFPNIEKIKKSYIKRTITERITERITARLKSLKQNQQQELLDQQLSQQFQTTGFKEYMELYLNFVDPTDNNTQENILYKCKQFSSFIELYKNTIKQDNPQDIEQKTQLITKLNQDLKSNPDINDKNMQRQFLERMLSQNIRYFFKLFKEITNINAYNLEGMRPSLYLLKQIKNQNLQRLQQINQNFMQSLLPDIKQLGCIIKKIGINSSQQKTIDNLKNTKRILDQFIDNKKEQNKNIDTRLAIAERNYLIAQEDLNDIMAQEDLNDIMAQKDRYKSNQTKNLEQYIETIDSILTNNETNNITRKIDQIRSILDALYQNIIINIQNTKEETQQIQLQTQTIQQKILDELRQITDILTEIRQKGSSYILQNIQCQINNIDNIDTEKTIAAIQYIEKNIKDTQELNIQQVIEKLKEVQKNQELLQKLTKQQDEIISQQQLLQKQSELIKQSQNNLDEKFIQIYKQIMTINPNLEYIQIFSAREIDELQTIQTNQLQQNMEKIKDIIKANPNLNEELDPILVALDRIMLEVQQPKQIDQKKCGQLQKAINIMQQIFIQLKQFEQQSNTLNENIQTIDQQFFLLQKQLNQSNQNQQEEKIQDIKKQMMKLQNQKIQIQQQIFDQQNQNNQTESNLAIICQQFNELDVIKNEINN